MYPVQPAFQRRNNQEDVTGSALELLKCLSSCTFTNRLALLCCQLVPPRVVGQVHQQRSARHSVSVQRGDRHNQPKSANLRFPWARPRPVLGCACGLSARSHQPGCKAVLCCCSCCCSVWSCRCTTPTPLQLHQQRNASTTHRCIPTACITASIVFVGLHSAALLCSWPTRGGVPRSHASAWPVAAAHPALPAGWGCSWCGAPGSALLELPHAHDQSPAAAGGKDRKLWRQTTLMWNCGC